jgi:hypothetical protein
MPISNLLIAPFNQKLRSYLKLGAHDQYVIPTTPRVVSAQVMTSTFRVAGLASAAQTIFFCQNAAGSTVLMAVRRLSLQVEANAAVTTVAPSAYTYKVTSSLPTGGTATTKHLFDSNDSSSASCTANCAASAEGTASAITWTAPAGTPGWRQFIMRMHTLAGQVLYPDESLIPLLCDTDPIILRAGQALVVQINIASVTTTHYTVNCMWEEFTLP